MCSVTSLVLGWEFRQTAPWEYTQCVSEKNKYSIFTSVQRCRLLIPFFKYAINLVLLQLNICRYRKSGLTLRKTSGSIQVSGFTNADTYKDVIERSMKGLSISSLHANLELVVSGGIVRDTPLEHGEPWTLGGYVDEIGGSSVRGKKCFGIYVPIDTEEEEEYEEVKV